MKLHGKKIIGWLIAITLVLSFVCVVYAQAEYVPLSPLPGTTIGDGPGAKTDFPTYVQGAYRLFFGLAFVFAVLMIVIGGVQYMSTDAIFKKQEGKNKIQNAIYGLILVLASYLILQTINPDLVNFDLNLELPPPETITCHPHQAQPTEPGVYLIEWFHNDGRCPVTQYSRYTKFATMDACGAAERESTAPSHMCTEMKGGAACFIVDVYSPGRFWGWYYESTERKCQIADKVGNSGAAMGACNTEMILYASKRRDTDTTRYVVKTGCHFQ